MTDHRLIITKFIKTMKLWLQVSDRQPHVFSFDNDMLNAAPEFQRDTEFIRIIQSEFIRIIQSWIEASCYHHGEFSFEHDILSAAPEFQRDLVMLVIHLEGLHPTYIPSLMLDHIITLLGRRLPFTYDDVVALVQSTIQHSSIKRLQPHIAQLAITYLATNQRTPALEDAVAQLLDTMERNAWSIERRKLVIKLKESAGIDQLKLPLQPGDLWADAAIAEIGALEPEQQRQWVKLFQHCATASGSSPNAKWRKTAQTLVEHIGAAKVQSLILACFALADRPRKIDIFDNWNRLIDYQQLQERNIDVLRGLVWLCADDDSIQVAQALAALATAFYRKLPGVGARSTRLGNAAIWSLGQMPGQQGITLLSILKTKVKLAMGLKQIEAALATAAQRVGLSTDEMAELLVPTYGLTDVGARRELLGDVTVELVVGAGVEVRYTRADGKRLASAPKTLKSTYGETLNELTKTAREIKSLLPAQRDRIEQGYLKQKTWTLDIWRERYLDHMLIGTLARRLIWRFTSDGQQQSGIWHDGQIVGSDGHTLAGLDAQTIVALWHPLDEPTEQVLAWREWLVRHEVQQPFKQAHREIYLLTDAERTTGVYSNRFAAHILRQHQFNALCLGRSWKNQLRLLVDDAYPPATRLLPNWGLRAEYWIEGTGNNYGTDTNDAGTYLYLVTDQVRFYPINAPLNYADAGGGGYHTSRWNGQGQNTDINPVPLETIPPLVLSEILRDVDLFVGVASVGNDPQWADGGSQTRYRTYWTNYSFGELSETAKTRRAVLEHLIPRLKIAPRCQLSERFLHVHGDLRSYKIHLGSGNILMEPNDQYLCIVPARGATEETNSLRFVPFEGDGTLAIILSKALMLAEDRKITDSTIVRQLQR